MGRGDDDLDRAVALTRAIHALEPDARRVVELLVERLRQGRLTYGELQLAADGRDWRQEAAEEAIDGLIYSACALLTERE